MAGVLLSYDRRDQARAKAIATALEKAGHSVWWDPHIHGGAQFAKAIDEALKQADVVVVLWSVHSVESSWVRDEAAMGRDRNKLVPATLDGTEAPLGFRQFQVIDLATGGARGSSAQFARLISSIEAIAGPLKPPVVQENATAGHRAFSRTWLWAAGALVLLAAGLAYWLRSSPAGPMVTVEAADNSTASKALARDLYIKLGLLPTEGREAMTLVEADNPEAAKADFIFEAQAPSGSGSATLVLLSGEERTLLWAKDFDLPPERRSDLKNQAGVVAGKVLGCALESRQPDVRLNERLTKLYLNACAILAEYNGMLVEPALPTLQQVTRASPTFEGGWTKLLLAEGQMASARMFLEDDSSFKNLRRHIVEVRRRFPDNAAASFAEIELLPSEETVQKLAKGATALQSHPRDANLLTQHALLLFRVGRLSEAVAHSKQAADADPMSARARAYYIAVLAYSGLIDRAQQELGKAEKLWPGSWAILDARSRVHARFGDPRIALAIERSGAFGDERYMEPFLLARIDPKPTNIERAIAAEKAMFGRDPRALGFLMQTMGEFGRNDELYHLLLAQKELPTGTAGVLFRPPLREFRRDPRFMQVANRFGLVEMWRSSGRWPDFCSEPGFPYDCKAEAKRVAA